MTHVTSYVIAIGYDSQKFVHSMLHSLCHILLVYALQEENDIHFCNLMKRVISSSTHLSSADHFLII